MGFTVMKKIAAITVCIVMNFLNSTHAGTTNIVNKIPGITTRIEVTGWIEPNGRAWNEGDQVACGVIVSGKWEVVNTDFYIVQEGGPYWYNDWYPSTNAKEYMIRRWWRFVGGNDGFRVQCNTTMNISGDHGKSDVQGYLGVADKYGRFIANSRPNVVMRVGNITTNNNGENAPGKSSTDAIPINTYQYVSESILQYADKIDVRGNTTVRVLEYKCMSGNCGSIVVEAESSPEIEENINVKIPNSTEPNRGTMVPGDVVTASFRTSKIGKKLGHLILNVIAK